MFARCAVSWQLSAKRRVCSSLLNWPSRSLRSLAATFVKLCWCARPAECSSESSLVTFVPMNANLHLIGLNCGHEFQQAYLSFAGIPSPQTRKCRWPTGKFTSGKQPMPSSASRALRGTRGQGDKRQSHQLHTVHSQNQRLSLFQAVWSSSQIVWAADSLHPTGNHHEGTAASTGSPILLGNLFSALSFIIFSPRLQTFTRV